MSGYNTKKYTEQNGEVTHIGGKLVFDEGSSVENFPGGGGESYTLPAATASKLGGVKVGSGLSITGSGVLSADPQTPSAATQSTAGVVRMMENQPNAAGSNLLALQSAFNSLLTKLKAAGLMTADE